MAASHCRALCARPVASTTRSASIDRESTKRTPTTAGADFAFPQTRGVRPPGTAERARYFAELDKLAQEDSEVLRLMTEVFHLVQPLSVLQQGPLRSRVLSRFAS